MHQSAKNGPLDAVCVISSLMQIERGWMPRRLLPCVMDQGQVVFDLYDS